MSDDHDLQRFVDAQSGSYDQALAELRRGHKSSHWMWFVFPQIASLGSSPMAQRFAIGSLEEARAYLAHQVLGPRLIECSRVVADSSGTAEEIFGGIDALKLRSSMTLFAQAEPREPVFAAVLQRCYDGVPDPRTRELLGS